MWISGRYRNTKSLEINECSNSMTFKEARIMTKHIDWTPQLFKEQFHNVLHNTMDNGTTNDSIRIDCDKQNGS